MGVGNGGQRGAVDRPQIFIHGTDRERLNGAIFRCCFFFSVTPAEALLRVSKVHKFLEAIIDKRCFIENCFARRITQKYINTVLINIIFFFLIA